jgi:hypothetical protein
MVGHHPLASILSPKDGREEDGDAEAFAVSPSLILGRERVGVRVGF